MALHKTPAPPPEPPPLVCQSTEKTLEVTFADTPSVCSTAVSEHNEQDWNIDSDLNYYSDSDIDNNKDATWTSNLTSRVKTVIANLFTTAKDKSVLLTPAVLLPQVDTYIEPCAHCVTINDGPNKGLTSHSRTEDETFNLRRYDIETKAIIE